MKVRTTDNASRVYSIDVSLKLHVESKLDGRRWPKALSKARDAFIVMAAADSYFNVAKTVGEYVSQDASSALLRLVTRAAGSVMAGLAISRPGITPENTLEYIRRATSKECDFSQYETMLRKELDIGWEHPWRRISPEAEARSSQGGRPPMSKAELLARSRMLTFALENDRASEAQKLSSSIYQHLRNQGSHRN